MANSFPESRTCSSMIRTATKWRSGTSSPRRSIPVRLGVSASTVDRVVLPRGLLEQLERLVQVLRDRRAGELRLQRVDRAVEQREVADLEDREIVEAVAHGRYRESRAVEARH